MHIDLCHTPLCTMGYGPYDTVHYHTTPHNTMHSDFVSPCPLPPPFPAPYTGSSHHRREESNPTLQALSRTSSFCTFLNLYLESPCTKYVVYLCQIQYMFATKLFIPPCPTVVVCEPSTLGPIWVKFHTCPLIRLQAKRHSLHIVHFWIR